jgi:glycosyltransferase involved in cell wall biosynthesis
MKICLVTAFPPSRQALNEYGFHVARELSQTDGLSLTVLGDDIAPDEEELPGYSVIRCWSFNSLRNPVRLLRTIRQVQPDVVWFNLGFASFGGKPLPAFFGVALPAMVRAVGFYTHVTLHQLMETVDLKDAGVRFRHIYTAAGYAATQLLLFANSISVLMPAYRSIIRKKYGRGAVYVRNHGILSGKPEYPAFARRGNPEHRILAFGKWGTYKRLEPMLKAFEIVARAVPNTQLIIAGTDHPKTPGYLESIRQKCWRHPRIKFMGYVPEEQIPELFQSTTVTVMPYTSSAGSSGVAHLACAYGVPMVASDISDSRELAQEEGLAIDFFKAGDVQSLAGCLIALLENPEHQTEMAIQNFSAALRISMPEIIRQYLRTFHLQRHLDLLTSVSRLRRLPKWLPLRPRLARLASRRLIAGLATAPRAQLLNGQSNGRGDILVPGAPVNGNGKGLAWSVSAGDGLVAVAGAATGDETACNQGQHEQPSDSPDYLSRAPSSGNGNGHTHNAEARQPKSVSQWAPAGLPPSILHRGNRRGNGEFGTDDLSSGGNGTGHKGAAHADGQPGAGKRDGARERAGDGSDGDLRAG